jgi:hypothetical protein
VSNPWAISDEAAAARDRAVLASFIQLCQRVIEPGMPREVIIFKLAQRGITSWNKRVIDAARRRCENRP